MKKIICFNIRTLPSRKCKPWKLIVLFFIPGDSPQTKPIILVDRWYRYQVEQLEYIELFQCWKAALREGTGWNN